MAELDCSSKTCSGCGETKNLSEFYAHPDGRLGRAGRCIRCVKAAQKAYRQANQDYHRERNKKYHEENREKVRETKRDYFSRNRERALELNRKSQQRNAKKHCERGRNRYREMREQVLERCRKWKLENTEKRNEHAAARRAAKRNALPPWANRKAIQAIYRDARRDGLHVDHIVPLISKLVCGLHCEANLQLLTPSANFEKSNRVWPDMP